MSTIHKMTNRYKLESKQLCYDRESNNQLIHASVADRARYMKTSAVQRHVEKIPRNDEGICLSRTISSHNRSPNSNKNTCQNLEEKRRGAPKRSNDLLKHFRSNSDSKIGSAFNRLISKVSMNTTSKKHPVSALLPRLTEKGSSNKKKDRLHAVGGDVSNLHNSMTDVEVMLTQSFPTNRREKLRTRMAVSDSSGVSMLSSVSNQEAGTPELASNILKRDSSIERGFSPRNEESKKSPRENNVTKPLRFASDSKIGSAMLQDTLKVDMVASCNMSVSANLKAAHNSLPKKVEICTDIVRVDASKSNSFCSEISCRSMHHFLEGKGGLEVSKCSSLNHSLIRSLSQPEAIRTYNNWEHHQPSFVKGETVEFRKKPVSSLRPAQYDAQKSLPKRVSFDPTSLIIDAKTSRKSLVSTSNPGLSKSQRSISKKEEKSRSIDNRDMFHRYPLSSKQPMPGRNVSGRRALCTSKDHSMIRSVTSHQRQVTVRNELNLSKHRATLSAFYPNIQRIREVKTPANMSELARKHHFEPPSQSCLRFGIDTELPQYNRKQTYSSAA